MSKFFTILMTSSALGFAAPVSAQDSAAQAPVEQPVPASPERLAAAKTTVDYLFPLGTYQRMMKGTMDQMMDAMMGQFGNMTMGDLMGASGLPEGEMSDDEKGETLREMALKSDPDYDERMKISTKVMMDEMVDLMSTMEPAIRDSLVSIYARKYTASQLGEMNNFFASDTGSAFARDYMMVFVDPEMMQSMMKMVPELMGAMPDIMKKVEDATAHLPKIEPVDPFGAMEEAVSECAEDEDCIAEAADAAGEDDEPAWSKPENWAKEDRENVEKMEAAADRQYDVYDEKLVKYSEAIETAQENARKKLEKSE